jgi:hypothetical protein
VKSQPLGCLSPDAGQLSKLFHQTFKRRNTVGHG